MPWVSRSLPTCCSLFLKLLFSFLDFSHGSLLLLHTSGCISEPVFPRNTFLTPLTRAISLYSVFSLSPGLWYSSCHNLNISAFEPSPCLFPKPPLYQNYWFQHHQDSRCCPTQSNAITPSLPLDISSAFKTIESFLLKTLILMAF